MKTNPTRLFVSIFTFAVGLVLADAVHAQVTVVNTPISSYASNYFDDANSLNPSSQAGAAYSSGAHPWGGASVTIGPTTDPTTSDFAQGGITAAVIAGNYSLSLNNVVLNQALVNSGFATLDFNFYVQFQIGAGGLAIQPTVFPNFAVNGTVLNAGGFASVTGTINYYGVSTVDGVNGLMDTVTYNDLWNTPGNFSGTAVGTPMNGFTDTLDPNSTLELAGNIVFKVDPADINVQTVPEPGSVLLVGMGALLCGFLLRRKRA